MSRTTILLDHIAKIEGHAKLVIRIENGVVEQADIQVYENSRFFEGIVVGRHLHDLGPITARICGVCSPAHAIAAVKAIEAAFDIEVSRQTHLLRELLLLANFVQSHVLHLYFLLLPDYLGFGHILEMVEQHGEKLRSALALKRLGNEIAVALGGREVHPLTVVPGGMSALPEPALLRALGEKLRAASELVDPLLELFTKLVVPSCHRTMDFACLSFEGYELCKGNITCSTGLRFEPSEHQRFTREFFMEEQTAEFAMLADQPYIFGALARTSMNRDRLPYDLQTALPFAAHATSPFHTIAAQAVEICFCVRRAASIIDELLESEIRSEGEVQFEVRDSVGVGVVEAPRGLLFHRYSFDSEGYCTAADITTPTSQNLHSMQVDLRLYLEQILDRSDDEIRLEIGKLVRVYDPCISCSTHVLC